MLFSNQQQKENTRNLDNQIWLRNMFCNHGLFLEIIWVREIILTYIIGYSLARKIPKFKIQRKVNFWKSARQNRKFLSTIFKTSGCWWLLLKPDKIQNRIAFPAGHSQSHPIPNRFSISNPISIPIPFPKSHSHLHFKIPNPIPISSEIKNK